MYANKNSDQSPEQNTIKLWKENTCVSWKKLSEMSDFPLQAFAKTRFEYQCEKKYESNLSSQLNWKQKILNELAPQTAELEDDIAMSELQWKLASQHFPKENAIQTLISLYEKKNSQDKISFWRMELFKNSPRLNPDLQNPNKNTFEQNLSVAQDYKESLNYTKSILFFKSALSKCPDEKKWELYKNIRQTYKLAQQTSEMLKMSDTWLNWSEKQYKKNPNLWREKYYEAGLTTARSLWTEEKKNRALRVLQRLLKHSPTQAARSDISYIQGRIAEQDHNYDLAIQKYSQALQLISQNKNKEAEKILTSLAWLKYKLKQYSDSSQLFSDLARLSEKNASTPWSYYKALYWQAKSLKNLSSLSDSNEKQNYKKIFEQIVAEDIFGYYGLLSGRELDLNLKKINLNHSALNTAIFESLSLKSEDIQAMNWALLLGETSILDDILLNLEKLLKPESPENIWLEFFKLQARSGKFLSLFAKVNQAGSELRKSIYEQNIELMFPTLFLDQIKMATKPYPYSPSLVFSIIRQESAFNPFAKSGADALGLMQLLPLVAKEQSSKIGLTFKSADQLYEPEFNIKLGSYELSRLLKNWDNQYIPAIASYNANSKTVKNWIKFRFRNDPVEFIEEIPYEETKAYVKLVIRNYMFYERILSTQDIKFDEKLLKLFNKNSMKK